VIRALVVADIRLYRDGLADLLARESDIDVVGRAGAGDEASGLASHEVPDVIVLDMAMLESTTMARRLRRACPQTKIVALAVPETEPHVLACAEAGAVAYVAREASISDLASAVRGAQVGEATASPRMTAALLRRVAALSAADARRAPVHALTARELEIVGLIDRGLSNKQIACELSVEVTTVKNHVHRILEKLGANGRAQAAAQARDAGLLVPVLARKGSSSLGAFR
jgi:two-component system, NarL family, nitrate/nitrite response regulator NarL